LRLLEASFRQGAPAPLHVLLFVGMRVIPRRIRWRLRSVLGRTAPRERADDHSVSPGCMTA
jgi:hypothetical protein